MSVVFYCDHADHLLQIYIGKRNIIWTYHINTKHIFQICICLQIHIVKIKSPLWANPSLYAHFSQYISCAYCLLNSISYKPCWTFLYQLGVGVLIISTRWIIFNLRFSNNKLKINILKVSFLSQI